MVIYDSEENNEDCFASLAMTFLYFPAVSSIDNPGRSRGLSLLMNSFEGHCGEPKPRAKRGGAAKQSQSINGIAASGSCPPPKKQLENGSKKIPLDPPFAKGEDLKTPSFGKGGLGRILQSLFLPSITPFPNGVCCSQ